MLQLKRGSLRPAYFADKYHVNVLDRFRDGLARLESQGYLAEASTDRVALTRDALLRVDVLLRNFFLPQHSGIRYT